MGFSGCKASFLIIQKQKVKKAFCGFKMFRTLYLKNTIIGFFFKPCQGKNDGVTC